MDFAKTNTAIRVLEVLPVLPFSTQMSSFTVVQNSVSVNSLLTLRAYSHSQHLGKCCWCCFTGRSYSNQKGLTQTNGLPDILLM